MRTTSPLYKELRNARGSYYEILIQCGNRDYPLGDIREAKIFPALYENTGPKIGGSHSAECDITIRETSENWPRMASFTVKLRLCSEDNTQRSEWISMGKFYTDQREKTEYGYLHVVGFDKCLFLEEPWAEKIPEERLPASWPITSQEMADLLVLATGIEIDPRTKLDNTVKCWGLSTAGSARDRWADIASLHGCNLIITPEEKILLVPLTSGAGKADATAGVAVAGLAIAGTGTRNADIVDIGMRGKRITTSPKLAAVSGVILETEQGAQATAGTDSGYMLKGICNFASTDGVAHLCLSKVANFEYQPFRWESAPIDPAAEPGDLVKLPNGDVCQIVSLEWNLGKHPRANISAPFETEIDHEYSFPSESTRSYRKAVAATDEKLKDYSTTAQMNSAIEQTASQIELSVDAKLEDYYTVTETEARITATSSEITSTVSREITQTAGGNLLARTGDFNGWYFDAGHGATYETDEALHQVAVTIDNADGYGIFYADDAFTPERNQEYVFSCFAKKTGDIERLSVDIASRTFPSYAFSINFPGADIGSEWAKIVGHFTTGEEIFNPYRVHITLYQKDGITEPVTVSLKELKIEKGDLATDWTPSWEDKTTSSKIISTINQSPESVTINAGKINLQGYVTMSALSTAGETTINGANITTGTINANRITAHTITADRIVNGSISYSSGGPMASGWYGGAVGGNNFTDMTAQNYTADWICANHIVCYSSGVINGRHYGNIIDKNDKEKSPIWSTFQRANKVTVSESVSNGYWITDNSGNAHILYSSHSYSGSLSYDTVNFMTY